MFKSFLTTLKPHNPALIESIETAYSLCFENVDGDETITNEYQSRWGMWKLSLNKSGNEIAYLIYSVNPITTYTTREGRDPENYINIEMIHTDDKYQRMGYATKLLKELLNIKADNFPDKQIIATGNIQSRDLLRKFGILNLA
jgi:ribosomal protein S18 acetylase RimI-like enzyme